MRSLPSPCCCPLAPSFPPSLLVHELFYGYLHTRSPTTTMSDGGRVVLMARFAVDGHCHSVRPRLVCGEHGERKGRNAATTRESVPLSVFNAEKFKKPNRNLASIVGRAVGPLFSGLPVPAPVAESAPAPWSFRSCAACAAAAAAARDKNRLRNEPRGRPPARRDGRERKKGGAKNETFVTAVSCKSKWARSLARLLCAACDFEMRIFRTFFTRRIENLAI